MDSAPCAGTDPEIVKTGQGLVLGATTGSRPQLELLLAEGPASGTLLLFTGCWTLWELQVWIFNLLFGLFVDCGSFAANSGGGCGSVGGLVPPWAAMQWCVLALPWDLIVSWWSWACVSSCSSVWLCWPSSWMFKVFILLGGGFAVLTSLATKAVSEVLDWKLLGAFRRRMMEVPDWGGEVNERFSWD